MQSYRNLEIILVNDGSTDSSGMLCDEYAAKDPRARVIHQPNKGLGAACNAGQNAAHGDYLWFPEGKDYFHKDIIRIMYEAINQSGENGRVYDLAVVEHKWTMSMLEDVSRPVMIDIVSFVSQDEIIHALFKSAELYTAPWNILYRRRFIEGILAENYSRSQDWDYNFKVFLRIDNGIKIKNALYYEVGSLESLSSSEEYVPVLAQCKTLMFYRHYIDLPEDKKKYGHYLLDGMYRMIIEYEERLYGKERRQEVVEHCRKIIRKTWRVYLCCPEIPLRKKLSRLCRAEYPWLSHRISESAIVSYMQNKKKLFYRQRTIVWLLSRMGRKVKPLEMHEQSKLLIITIAYNHVRLIEKQIEFVKRYVRDDGYYHLIVDNSPDFTVRKEIKSVCEKSNAGYVEVPSFIDKMIDHKRVGNGMSHGAALNWAFYHVCKSFRPEYLVLLDHDVFPIKEYSFTEKIGKCDFYGVLKIRVGGGWYLWPGWSLFRFENMEKITPDFLPTYINGVFLDAGGGNYTRLYKNYNLKDVIFPRVITKRVRETEALHTDGDIYHGDSMQVIDQAWIHVINGSNWANISGKKESVNDTLKNLDYLNLLMIS